MIVLQQSDFTGFYKIAKSTASNPILQSYIDEFEKKYILDILGIDLGNLFIASPPLTTIDPRMVAIRDPFDIQYGNSPYHSKGMKEVLLAFVYYEYISQTQVQHSLSGVVQTQNETANSTQPIDAHRFGETKFNSLLETVEAIQWYCRAYQNAIYPEYRGVDIAPKFSAIL